MLGSPPSNHFVLKFLQPPNEDGGGEGGEGGRLLASIIFCCHTKANGGEEEDGQGPAKAAGDRALRQGDRSGLGTGMACRSLILMEAAMGSIIVCCRGTWHATRTAREICEGICEDSGGSARTGGRACCNVQPLRADVMKQPGRGRSS